MTFKVDYCGKLVRFASKLTKFSESTANYGASQFWSIFQNFSKIIVEMAFEFEGAVTQKRTGCFEKGGYRANKLLFWILPSGEVGCTETRLSFVWFFENTWEIGFRKNIEKLREKNFRVVRTCSWVKISSMFGIFADFMSNFKLLPRTSEDSLCFVSEFSCKFQLVLQ